MASNPKATNHSKLSVVWNPLVLLPHVLKLQARQTVTNETVLLWAQRAAADHEKKAPKDCPIKQKARLLRGTLRFPFSQTLVTQARTITQS